MASLRLGLLLVFYSILGAPAASADPHRESGLLSEFERQWGVRDGQTLEVTFHITTTQIRIETCLWFPPNHPCFLTFYDLGPNQTFTGRDGVHGEYSARKIKVIYPDGYSYESFDIVGDHPKSVQLSYKSKGKKRNYSYTSVFENNFSTKCGHLYSCNGWVCFKDGDSGALDSAPRLHATSTNEFYRLVNAATNERPVIGCFDFYTFEAFYQLPFRKVALK